MDDSANKGRTGYERRVVSIIDPADGLAGTHWKQHVAAVTRVQREVFSRSSVTGLLRQTTETAFYVCSATISAEPAAKAIRAHWSTENTSHCTRDITLGEDRSRICNKPGVFARLGSFAFNINKPSRISTLSRDRYRATLAGIENPLQFRGAAQRWFEQHC